MEKEDKEYLELLLDELNSILSVRLLFNRTWNSVVAQIDLDDESMGRVLRIKWYDHKFRDDKMYYEKREIPVEDIDVEIERQRDKMKEDIPDDDTVRILYEAVKDYADYDANEEPSE
jgi:hypothetical protein